MDHFPMSWGRPVRLFCALCVGVRADRALSFLICLSRLVRRWICGVLSDLPCGLCWILRFGDGSATTLWTRSTPTRCTSVRSTERILLLRACSGHSQSCSSFDVIWKH